MCHINNQSLQEERERTLNMNYLGKSAILRELWDAVGTDVHTLLALSDGMACGQARIVQEEFDVWLVHEGNDPAHGEWLLCDRGRFTSNWQLGN
jgi:hypothetical protein